MHGFTILTEEQQRVQLERACLLHSQSPGLVNLGAEDVNLTKPSASSFVV